jgi:hypothetical protein
MMGRNFIWRREAPGHGGDQRDHPKIRYGGHADQSETNRQANTRRLNSFTRLVTAFREEDAGRN